jgi:hypothetical protein
MDFSSNLSSTDKTLQQMFTVRIRLVRSASENGLREQSSIDMLLDMKPTTDLIRARVSACYGLTSLGLHGL